MKNGYTDGVGGVSVTPFQDASNNRRLRVTVSGPVNTFFARVLGINSFSASRSSKAEYVLPVPMGSPENYYGVFGLSRHPGGGITTVTTNTFTNVTTSWFSPTALKGTNAWTNPSNVFTSNDARATSATANQLQQWGTLGVTFNGTVTAIRGIELSAEMSRSGSGNQSNCQVQFDLSYNNGGNFTTGTGLKTSTAIPLQASEAYQSLGNTTDTWGRTWAAGDFSNTNFRIRAKTIKPTTAVCAAAIVHQIDHLRVRVTYDYTTTTSVFTPDTNVASPYGGALTPRGFWGVMLTEGAESVNGDAYSPFYDTRTSANNPNFKPNDYYDYAVEMPAGSSSGEVWIYDPGFCAVASDMGTGDRYFGNTNTNGSNEVSAYYDLYDTKNTLYDISDDGAAVASSGSTFAHLAATDESMNGPALSGGNLADCSDTAVGSDTTNPQYYHNRWWRLASGLAGNKTYRVHVTSTNLANLNDQKNMNGQNSFAIWTSATGVVAEGPRPGRHGGVHAARAEHERRVLPGPDRGRPRRQDHGDQALGPGRHEQPVGQPPDPDPDDHRLHQRLAELHRGQGHDQLGRQQLQLHERHRCLEHPDQLGRQRRPAVQWLLGDHPDPDPDHLHGADPARRGRARLVEDPLQHGQR